MINFLNCNVFTKSPFNRKNYENSRYTWNSINFRNYKNNQWGCMRNQKKLSFHCFVVRTVVFWEIRLQKFHRFFSWVHLIVAGSIVPGLTNKPSFIQIWSPINTFAIDFHGFGTAKNVNIYRKGCCYFEGNLKAF